MSLRHPAARLAFAALSAVALVRCVVELDPFTGKTCQTHVDCPEGYGCEIRGPDEPRTCGPASLVNLQTVSTSVDGGDVYCGDVERAVASNCGLCHSRDTTHVKTHTFQVQYFTQADSGVPLPGVREYRSQMRERLRQRTMPPSTHPQPSAYERAIMLKWMKGSGVYGDCNSDAGDGGAGDAGDGG